MLDCDVVEEVEVFEIDFGEVVKGFFVVRKDVGLFGEIEFVEGWGGLSVFVELF